MSQLTSKFKRVAICGLVAWCSFVWSGGPQLVAWAAADDAEESARIALQIHRSLLAIEDGRAISPRDRWDPQYVVDSVGIEPEDLASWVRANVRWVPYRGVLRGAIGVLMDRRGNSLDQALLLAELLRLAGYQVRLVHATLPPDSLPAMWANLDTRFRDAPADMMSIAASSPADDAATTAELYDLQPAAVTNALDASASQGEQLFSELAARVVDQTGRLFELVPGPPVDQLLEEEFVNALVALGDHWWVQYSAGGGWHDLDPLAPGDAAIAMAETLHSPDALPEHLHHQVTVRVVVEQWRNGETQEQAILEHRLRPLEVIGERITLRHVPLNWPPDWRTVTPDDVQVKLFAAIASQHTWAPALEIGQQTFMERGINDNGEVLEAPISWRNPMAPVGISQTGSFGRAADILLGGDEESKIAVLGTRPEGGARLEGELVAEWIEYELRRPGHETEIIRREVFDLIGPARRRAGDMSELALTEADTLTRSMALLAESELVIMPSDLPAEFLLELAARAVLANRPILDEYANDPFGRVPANYYELFQKVVPGPGLLYGLASIRGSALAQQSAIFLDRPLIIAQHLTLAAGGPGEFVFRRAIDFIVNGVGVDQFARVDPFLARLTQGVVDTNLEALVLGLDAVAPIINVGEHLAEGSAQTGLVLIEAETADETMDRLGLSPDFAARLAEQLEAGFIALVPMQGAERVGWFRINPMTGETLGIGPNGWGAAMVEYALLLVVFLVSLAECLARAHAEKKFADQPQAASAGDEPMTGAAAARMVRAEVDSAFDTVKASALKCSVMSAITLVQFALIQRLHQRIMAQTMANVLGGGGPRSSGPGGGPAGTRPGLGPGGSPAGTQPGLGPAASPSGTGAGSRAASRTGPDLSKTQPDLSKTQPDLSKTQPDLRKTQPDLSKTQPHVSRARPNKPQMPPSVESAIQREVAAIEKVRTMQEEYRASNPQGSNHPHDALSGNPEYRQAVQAWTHASADAHREINYLDSPGTPQQQAQWNHYRKQLTDQAAGIPPNTASGGASPPPPPAGPGQPAGGPQTLPGVSAPPEVTPTLVGLGGIRNSLDRP